MSNIQDIQDFLIEGGEMPDYADEGQDMGGAAGHDERQGAPGEAAQPGQEIEMPVKGAQKKRRDSTDGGKGKRRPSFRLINDADFGAGKQVAPAPLPEHTTAEHSSVTSRTQRNEPLLPSEATSAKSPPPPPSAPVKDDQEVPDYLKMWFPDTIDSALGETLPLVLPKKEMLQMLTTLFPLR